MSLMLDPRELARRQAAESLDYYQVGQAYWLLNKEAAAPIATPVLHGRLVVSKSGWALLTVPNALVRGLFDAMDEKGIELPPGHEGGPFTAHVSVMRGEEVDKIGGPDKISERGHPFSYQLGPLMSVEPKGWSDMSRVWFVKVISPELKALRKSYGLDPLPNGDHDFHISVAVRRKNVLSQGPTSKAAADESDEDVHSGDGADVHLDDDNDQKLKLPLVMRRIVYSETQLSFGKPGDDDDGIKQFMDQIRERHGSTKEAGALDALAKVLAGVATKARPALAGIGQAATKARPALAGIGQAATRARPAFAGIGQAATRAGPALANFGQRAVSTAAPVVQRAVATAAPVARATAQGTGNVIKHMASVPKEEAFAPSVGSFLKNVKNLATKTRYPILDRPPGVKSMDRILDRTRAAAGTAVRKSPWIGAGVGGVTGLYEALWGIPNTIADTVRSNLGYTGDPEPLREKMRSAARRTYWEGGKNLVGLGSDDPTSKFVHNVAGDVAVPSLRYAISPSAEPRKLTPSSVTGMTTPLGVANTLGLLDPILNPIRRWVGSDKPPDIQAAARRHAPALFEELSKNPGALTKSPYAQIIHDLLPEDLSVVRQVKPRELIANVAANTGLATPGQEDRIRGVDLPSSLGAIGKPAYNPTVGELEAKAKQWAQMAQDPEQRRAVLDRIRHITPDERTHALDVVQQYLPEKQRNAMDDFRQLTPEARQQRIDLFKQQHNLPQNVQEYLPAGISEHLPPGMQERINTIRNRILEGRRLVEKGGAAREKQGADYVFHGEKQADASDVVRPALIGAGLGSAGGWSLGQIMGSDSPWRDTLYGGGLGGVIGARLGLEKARVAASSAPSGSSAPVVSTPDTVPSGPNTKMMSLEDTIKHYYKNVPGGYAGAVSRAQQNQQPYAPGMSWVPWQAEDLQAKVPVTTLSPREALIAKGRPVIKPGEELGGWANQRIDDAARYGGPVAHITSVNFPGRAVDTANNKEHELTHTALKHEPLRRLVADPKLTQKDIPDVSDQTSGNKLVRSLRGRSTMVPGSHEDYLTSTEELDPRLAPIKRFYAEKYNKEVTTPEEAQKAIKWFRNWITTAEGQERTGSMGQSWQDIFDLPEWPTIERGAIRRLPGLVHNQQLDDGTKMAAVDALSSLLSQWEPPKENPYEGFEGFAPKFQAGTPGEHWTESLGRMALTAAPVAATAGGLALWRPWEHPASPAKPKHHRRPVKTAAVSDVANAIYAQLPRIRVPDTLAGAGVGALGGLAYDAIRGAEPGEGRWKKRLGHALTGAGVGALGANVVGDRARRYISNSFVPWGYDNDPAKALMPKSLSHVWNAAILDRPQHEITSPEILKDVDKFGNPAGYEHPKGLYDYQKDTMRNYVLPARQELFRRQLGVHTDDPIKDIWKAGPDDRVSINPENPRGVETAQRLMGTPARGIPPDMFRDPKTFLDKGNIGRIQNTPFSTIVGGQQIPYREWPSGKGLEGSVLDRWDYTLDPKEDAFLRGNARNMLDPAWRKAPFDTSDPISGYLNDEQSALTGGASRTNADAWSALAGRWGLDNIISYKHPWVTQKFLAEPDMGPGGLADPKLKQLQMLTPEGHPFGDPITRSSNKAFTRRPFEEKKGAADYAPGLPAKKDFGPLERLRVGQMLDYIVQAHNAERAGPHHDIRFGDKDTGLFSWASRKGVPAPGEKRLAVQQPVHRHEYKDFEGEIPEGYGKGTVKKHTEGQVLITKTTPESIHFTTAHQRHPERFTLARPKGWGDKNWLMMNTTPRDQVPYEKVRYKKIPPEQVEPHLKAMQEGDTAEAKVDGASQLVQLAKGHAEMLSFRTSKQTGRPIFHTERFFGGRPDIPVPKHLEGSILKGEMYAAHTGRTAADGSAPPAGEPGGKIPSRNGGAATTTARGSGSSEIRAGTPQDVGTFLNSGIARSLQLQKERGMHLRNMLYDVQQYGKTPVDPAVTPRNERRKMLEEIAQHLPKDKFHVSEEAKDPEAAVKLWDMIRGGKHPLTEEGIVYHPRVGVPSKGKLTEEHDVHITGTFPGEGKRQATIGGFTYGHAPGKTVGKVGTGFSDSFLNEVARDPSAYTGRVARLRAQQKLPSGALRAPSFIALHEDTNKTAMVKLAGLFGIGDSPSAPPQPTFAQYRQPFKAPVKAVPAPRPVTTGAALDQLAARPSLPPYPTGRAEPAMTQLSKVLGSNRPAAATLESSLHGPALRASLTSASRAGGYPRSPTTAPASTVGLLGRMYPHQLPPVRSTSEPTGGLPLGSRLERPTGQILLSDADDDRVLPNSLGTIRHEVEHGIQEKIPRPRYIPAPPGSSLEEEHAHTLATQDHINASETAASLGDLPFIAQAHKLETGKPLNAPVTVAPGITHDADWMARQAQQHGMFSGNKTTTELLATPAGQSYLKQLLDAQRM